MAKIQPVFTSVKNFAIPKLAAQTKSKELPFGSLGLSVKMGPGDFLLLGPKKHINNQISLAGQIFRRTNPLPVTRTYLIVCTRIKD